MDPEIKLEKYSLMVEKYLVRIFQGNLGKARGLNRAMNYAVFPAGKRIRPLLALAAGEICGVPAEKMLPAACGLELIHNFSLVHDDLPCMDNDDFRRGKPSCHKKFGQSQALLAGDALLSLGLGEIAKSGNCEAVEIAGKALGSDGMAGGQSLELALRNKETRPGVKKWIDRKKTGELFALCMEIPAVAGGCGKKKRAMLRETGFLFGKAFQILDDLTDGEGDPEKLKKRLERTCAAMLEKLAALDAERGLLETLINRIYGKFARSLNCAKIYAKHKEG